jgi:threonine/homoserine/homoserine lactone efflux protein
MRTLITVAGMVAIAAITPGPNNFVVMEAAARAGFAAAIRAILGVLPGSLILLATVWGGLGTALEAASWLRAALLWAGCLYLAWLGATLIRKAGRPADASPLAGPPETTLGLAIFQMLNPKSWVLITTAAAATAESGSGLADLASLAAILVVVSCICLTAWALAGAMIARWLETPPIRHGFDRVMGGLLVGSSLLLLL